MAVFRTRACVLLAAVCVAAATGRAQQPQAAPPPPPTDQQQQQQQQPPPPPPVFRGGINFVRVDVIATSRDGTPIADLQASDFEILEDDKPQKIEAFRFIELDGGLMQAADGPVRSIRTDADEQAEAARDDVRLFAIFLDDYHVRKETAMGSRAELARFIETQLGPTDMVAIMYPLQPLAAVRFSRNHDALRRALEQFEGRKFEYEPRNMYEEKYAYYPTEIVERIRNQVSLSALEGLVSHMGGLKEGRKTLILVSEGYSNMLPPQLRNPVAALGGLGNPSRRDPNAGRDDPNEFRAQTFASFDMQEDLRQVYEAANRNNVSIYPVDPRGLATSEFSIAENINDRTGRDYLNSTMDTLRVIAEQTDGRAIVNRNDLTIAMKQIVRDASAYYLIGYSSAAAPTDGKFHEIRVRVRRPGVQVRARRGYWAVTPADVERITAAAARPPVPKPVDTALAALNYPTRARYIRTWLGAERGENGRTRMTLVWEPVARPGAASREAERPDRVSVTAVAPDGSPYFRGRIAATSPRVAFDAAPGPLQLRLSIETADADVLDSETRELTVPDLSAGAVFGTPRLYRARTVRDVQQIRGSPQALPTAAREFQRTERLLIHVPVYGPAGAAAPAVTARLLNRTGQPMSDVPVADEGGVPVIELSLAPLPTGDYVLELSAAGSDVKELLAFRITS